MADSYKQDSVASLTKREHDDKNVGVKKVGLFVYDADADEYVRVQGTASGTLVSSGVNYATKITTSGSSTYVGLAVPGASQASAVWQAKKIDESTGTVVTWADGNADFDNVATDLTLLTYS